MSNEKLIEIMDANHCMYNKREAKYKDVKYKGKIWEEISGEMQLPVKECKVKWKSLRDRFRKEKVANDCPSGSAPKHTMPWKYGYRESLEFLADSLEPFDMSTSTPVT